MKVITTITLLLDVDTYKEDSMYIFPTTNRSTENATVN